jgi:cyclopropane fatty-acyl-phospholipid synthase-like methyltransferase
MAIPTRILWSVERLAFKPTDRLLEIGCGRGLAASLICARLTAGHLTAVDRSAIAIEAVRQRNAEHETAGKVTFIKTALADLDCSYGPFDKAFAINVNLFWVDPHRELPVVHDVLARGGRLLLFYEPPSPAQRSKIEELTLTHLERHGFSVDTVLKDDTGGSPLLGIVARPTG